MAYNTQANEETVAKQLERANHICKVMNELTKIDHPAISGLINRRVYCNDELAAHKDVTVFAPVNVANEPMVGVLGILNALIGAGTNGEAVLVAVYNERGLLTGFVVNQEALLLLAP